MKTHFLLLALVWSVVVVGQGTKKGLQNLSGTYKSVSSEDWGRGTFGYREFSFKDCQWTLRFILALDPALNIPVFEFRTEGSYTVLGKSKAANAYEALFIENKKFVTLKTDNLELIEGFGLADCGLTLNMEKDISEDGCALWPSVKNCKEDHDLLALDDQGNLYFGVRPEDNNMCTPDRRPTALLPPVVKTE